jgi:hypothetical protein
MKIGPAEIICRNNVLKSSLTIPWTSPAIAQSSGLIGRENMKRFWLGMTSRVPGFELFMMVNLSPTL